MRWAKRMVAMRPVVSWRMWRRRAVVGVAVGLPTPTPFFFFFFHISISFSIGLGEREGKDVPCKTALDAKRPAMELLKAWRESYGIY